MPEICILLATCQGVAHLDAQLDSYVAQAGVDWRLYAADDGSTDGTLFLLDRFATAHPGRVRVGPGPGQGAAANFLTLLARAVADRPGAAMAFSDQDDVWLPGKLARAGAWLDGLGPDAVAVWACRTVLVDAALTRLGESRVFPRPPCFGNALVQNILAGNTIVLSPAAARLVAQTVTVALHHGVPYHDWWTYQVVTGAGGQVRIEPEPLVLYRQHDANLMGHHDPFRGRLARLGQVMRRSYKGWLDANLGALSDHGDLLTPEHRALVQRFVTARQTSPRGLAKALGALGVHRQTAMGDRGLRLMARAGRL